MIGWAVMTDKSKPSYLQFQVFPLTIRRRYLILDILGQGTFGQVVKCQNMKTHEIVAVKVVKNKPAYFNQSMMEVTILELVRNKPFALFV
jgi:serine/threonine protein kinase